MTRPMPDDELRRWIFPASQHGVHINSLALNAIAQAALDARTELAAALDALAAKDAELAREGERAARICEALHRKGVLPEKWPDYFRVRAAGDALVARAALSPATDGEGQG